VRVIVPFATDGSLEPEDLRLHKWWRMVAAAGWIDQEEVHVFAVEIVGGVLV
jgi:hypothetical protein